MTDGERIAELEQSIIDLAEASQKREEYLLHNMTTFIINKAQADALAKLTEAFLNVRINYDYGGSLIVSYGPIKRATIYPDGKVEVAP